MGSPIGATDKAGALAWREYYWPYGERNIRDPKAAKDTRWFAGKSQDAESKLSYFGARYYDPLLGRFMGIDPVGVDESNVHSHNRYAYGNNNPYKFTDPNGNSPIDIVFLAVDIGRLGVAAYNGESLGGAAIDVAISAASVFSPVPGMGEVYKAGRAAEKAVEVINGSEKTFITYTKRNIETGEVYTGRTSGFGTPEEILSKRDASHHMNEKGFGTAKLDQVGSKDAIRGREQQMIEANGGAKSTGGTSGNAINGISATNKNSGRYNDAAKKEFGN